MDRFALHILLFCVVLAIHAGNKVACSHGGDEDEGNCTVREVCLFLGNITQKQEVIGQKLKEVHSRVIEGGGFDGSCGKFSISAVVQCTSVVQSSGQSHFKLEALSADKNQMCRTFGQHIDGKPPYRVSAELLNQAGWAGISSGHLGLLYNAIDENNFDFVYFRPHSASGCYQTGYMSKGNLHFLQTKACPSGPPKGGVWFPVSIMVNGQDVQIFYNKDLVASVKAHFAARAWGGVFSFHGYQNVVLFRKFQLVPQLYVSHGCAKIADGSDYVMLDANHGAWPQDGFCHVMYVKEGGAKAYQLSVEMFNFIGYQGVNSGHLGVMFNAQDENNFDFVYFRPHSVGGCFQTGYVYKGQPKFDGSKSSVCPHGPPKGAAWFQVQIAITTAGQATVYLKGSLVTSWMSRYPIKSRGGVVVANGYQNVVYFRNFQVQ